MKSPGSESSLGADPGDKGNLMGIVAQFREPEMAGCTARVPIDPVVAGPMRTPFHARLAPVCFPAHPWLQHRQELR